MTNLRVSCVLLNVAFGMVGCADSRMLPAAPTAVISASRGIQASARPADDCRNVDANVSAAFTGPGTAAGTISGDLNGGVTAEIQDIRTSGDGAWHVRMTHHYATAAGQIDTDDHAVLAPIGTARYRMNNRLAVVGGTGIYAGASGYLHTHGTVDLGAGTITLDLKGRVCTL